ncbi:hypothetical protein [Diaphorobacter sp.]|uniref:hypothetical protein n=1 Tax=Diaphorobacter sp. TaxID=1934310 RepID=UPI0028A7BD4E|nr:hypothetical protein [Diaphorobacter sp.]
MVNEPFVGTAAPKFCPRGAGASTSCARLDGASRRLASGIGEDAPVITPAFAGDISLGLDGARDWARTGALVSTARVEKDNNAQARFRAATFDGRSFIESKIGLLVRMKIFTFSSPARFINIHIHAFIYPQTHKTHKCASRPPNNGRECASVSASCINAFFLVNRQSTLPSVKLAVYANRFFAPPFSDISFFRNMCAYIPRTPSLLISFEYYLISTFVFNKYNRCECLMRKTEARKDGPSIWPKAGQIFPCHVRSS